jgi:prepilin-type N-terminal cleavage/methylation domain-containing protein
MKRHPDRHAAEPAPAGERRGRRGFTLIEILVAMMVFVTGVTGLLALLTTALAMHRDGLTLARTTRDIDGVAERVRAEVAAGLHFDRQHGSWTPIDAASLPGGGVCSVRFREPAGGGPLIAEIRLAGSERELPRAKMVPCAISVEPSMELVVERYRSRRTRTPTEH